MLMRDATKRDAIKASRALMDKFIVLGMGSIVGTLAEEDPAVMEERVALQNQVAEAESELQSVE
jgi:hypothetical protein